MCLWEVPHDYSETQSLEQSLMINMLHDTKIKWQKRNCFCRQGSKRIPGESLKVVYAHYRPGNETGTLAETTVHLIRGNRTHNPQPATYAPESTASSRSGGRSHFSRVDWGD